MFNSYLKLYPNGCQVRFFQSKNDTPFARRDLGCAAEHSDYNSYSRTRKRIYDYARANDFCYFVTLTFNPDKVDSFSCVDSYEHMRNWLNRMRKKFPDLKYLGVPELHKSGRYHFHFLMSDDIKSVLLDSGKFDNKGHKIYNLGSYRFGWSTVVEIYDKDRLPSYIIKYITKDLCKASPNRRRYWNSHNLLLPKCFATYMALEDFSALLERLDVIYSSKKETDFSYCDFYEVSFDSLGELLPFLENFRESFSDYSGIPDGFFPVKNADIPFD